MKKVFAIAMALLLGIAVLAGCGMDGAPPGTEAPEPEPELSPVEEDGSPADSDGVQADSDTAEDENAGQVPGYGSASVYGMEWGIGVGKWDEEAGGATRIAVYQSKGPGTGFNTASFGDKELEVRYIGMKEATGKGSVYFESYESTAGPEYEFVDPASAKGVPSGALFLYDREAWGDLAGRIHYAPGTFGREPADKGQTGDMEQAEGGRRVTGSELLGIFSLDGGSDNYLSLMRFENADDGLFKIVLYDEWGEYYTADYPCELLGDIAVWRADLFDEPGWWDLLFVGRIPEGIFLATAWAAPEGRFIIAFVARDGKLEEL